MAKGNVSLSYKIVIDGQQAKDEAKKLEASIDKASKAVAKLKKDYEQALAAGADKATLDGLSQQLKAEQANLKTLNKLWKDRVVQINGYEKQLKNLANLDYNQLTRLQSTLQRALKKLSPEDDIKSYQKLLEYIRQVDHELSGRKSDFKNYDESRKKMNEMAVAMKNVSALTDKQLVEQKAYWAAVSKGVDETSRHYKRYQQFIKEAADEEQRRKSVSAQQTITDIELGNWDKTIAESKEAVKQLQQYRDTLKDTDKVGLERVDKAIADLNTRIKGAQEGVLSMADALAKVDDLENFDGTIEDLEKLKKRLEEIRKTEINLGDDDAEEQIKEIDDALEKLNKRIKSVSEEAVDVEEVLKNLSSASFNDLTRAAEELQKQIKECDANSMEFIEGSEKLREVNGRIAELKENWTEHENVIIRTAKRLASYVLVYGGFNQIIGRAKELFNANLELSDSMADVQKTTGLSSEAVSHLSQNIDKIDTRSSQAALHELAAAAGQIGLRSEEDILGFVKASNMITVSLNELGSEGTASLMKIAQLTGEITTEGVEGSLLAIGSAINELSANSAATAGPIVDLMNRMGGIASMAKISSAEMAAIGATADALGQSMEITGTSMNKFITTVMSKSDKIAYSLNMDAKALRELIDSGQTMEAMLQIFERMNEMGGMSKLASIMGDLGSEGARMTQVLTSLSQNTYFLRSQVDLSREAYAQATSIQNEYNVKNENAIALLQRMGNTIRESFVNSGFVETLTNILRMMNDFVNWMQKGEGGARELEYILKALVITLGAASLKLDSFVKALFKAKTWTDAWTTSWRGLGKALKSNWISLLIGLVSSLVLYLRDVITHISELTKLQAEYSAELTKEQNIMDNLFATVKKENIERNEKKKLLYDINKRYGDYIGFLLKEEDGINKINAAYNLANAKLRERIALQFEEKKAALIQEDYAKQMRENEQDLRKAMDEFAPLQGLTGDAMSAVRKTVLSNLDKDTDDIIKLVNTALGEVSALYNSSEWEGTRLFDGGALGDVRDYIEIQKNYRAEINEQNKVQQNAIQQAQEDISKANVQMGIAMVTEFDRLMNQAREQTAQKAAATTEEEKKVIQDALNSTYRSILDQSAQFENYVKDNTETLTETQIEGAIKQRDRLRAQAAEIRKIAPFADAWGKSANLKGWKETLDNIDTASVDSLVSTYKELRDASKLISDVTKYNAMFGTSFESLGQVMDDTHEKAGKIKEQLASMGRTTTGDFLWKNGSDKSAKQKAREEYKAALSALDAYYKEREALIREQGAKEGALPTTVERNVDKLKEQWEKDKQELLKMLLGDASTFNPFANEGYMGVLTQNVFFGKNRDTGYLKNLAIQLSQFGIALEDGMRNTLSTSLVNTSKLVEEEVEKMRKVLLQDDFTEQVAQQYMESLDTLGLLFGLNEKELTDTTAEQGRQRLEAMREYADRSYSLTAEKLEEEMKQNALFDAWNIDRKREHYEVLLGELRKFHDDQIEADKKTAERRKKIADARFKVSGQQGAAEGNIKDSEAKLDFAKKMNEFGVGGEQVVNELEIEVLKQKIAYEQQWLALLAQESAAKQKQLEQDIANAELLMQKENDEAKRQELNNQLNQLRQQLASEQNAFAIASADSIDRMLEYQKNAADIYSQQFTGYFDKLKDYQSNIDSFAQSMGEGIFGSKEDRQQAGRELLASVLTTSKNLIQVWLTQLATRRLVDEMEVKQTEATEMRKRAIKLQSMIQDGTIAITGLSVDAAKTEASILLSSAEAAGKEAAKKGLIGLAVGAAINAALSALLGAALGKVNQSKAEIASATGASGGGKLATGMLTYAEGNYPVLGNDGKVYNARYEGKGMKTGVYGGGAHFGIFSEKQPEAIIDGKTTQRLMLNYPEIWKSIVTLSRVGKIERGMRTFATGNIQEIAAAATTADGTATAAQNEATLAMMNDVRALMAANMALMNKLATDGVKSSIDMYGNGGMYKSMEKASRFAKRRGY